jgi:hypothetical protein
VSEELRKFTTAIHVETDIALIAVALARGIDKTELARNILREWASEQHLISRLIQKKMKAEGIEGVEPK